MIRTIIFILLATVLLSAQDFNIVEHLKKIEDGNAQEVKNSLPALKIRYKDNPEVEFLDAVLTENGENALRKYENYYREHSSNRFADAALYRMFSYHYANGIYNKASGYLSELKEKYPKSPYISAANRTIPDEVEEYKAPPKPVVVKTPKVERPKPVTVKPEKNDNYLTVQAGAFSSKSNAQQLVNTIGKDGYKAKLITKTVAGSTFNVVMVGKFAERNEASDILEYLLSKHNLRGRVIPYVE